MPEYRLADVVDEHRGERQRVAERLADGFARRAYFPAEKCRLVEGRRHVFAYPQLCALGHAVKEFSELCKRVFDDLEYQGEDEADPCEHEIAQLAYRLIDAAVGFMPVLGLLLLLFIIRMSGAHGLVLGRHYRLGDGLAVDHLVDPAQLLAHGLTLVLKRHGDRLVRALFAAVRRLGVALGRLKLLRIPPLDILFYRLHFELSAQLGLFAPLRLLILRRLCGGLRRLRFGLRCLLLRLLR